MKKSYVFSGICFVILIIVISVSVYVALDTTPTTSNDTTPPATSNDTTPTTTNTNNVANKVISHTEWATGKARSTSAPIRCGPDNGHLVSLKTDKSERKSSNKKNGKIFSLSGVCSDGNEIGPISGRGEPSGNNKIDTVETINLTKNSNNKTKGLVATAGNRLEGLCVDSSCGQLIGGVHDNKKNLTCPVNSYPIGFDVVKGNLIDDFRLICST